MIFGIIMLLEKDFGGVVEKLSIVQPEIMMGLLFGGSVVYWFSGASTQAVVTGAYRAVVFIKENIKLDTSTASIEDRKEVVKICTTYAQRGMINIFAAIFCFALALPFIDPNFFIAYLVAIAFFGLFQALFMANAGRAWDNAKKIVEVDMRQKGTPLHAATVVQWHAKHGLVQFFFFVIIWVVIGIVTSTGIGCVYVFLYPNVGLAWLAVTIMSIVKATKGERFIIPGISEFANKF